MENALAPVEKAARKTPHGWTVIGLIKHRYSRGLRPGGLIAFVRDVAPFEDKRCGTATYYYREDGEVVFIHGHYDLTRGEALEDLVERAAVFSRDHLVTS